MKPKYFKSPSDLKKEIDAYKKLTEKKYKKKEDLPPHIVYYEKLKNEASLPQSNKSSPTKQKFNDHLKYKELVNDLNYPNGENNVQYDTWYKDIFYGRVDYAGNTIYHNYWIFQNISSDSSTEICVFDFVADAFDELKENYRKKKKKANSKFLQEISAKRGNSSTISPEIKYERYINNKFNNFLSRRSKELKVSNKIKNFNDFKNIFLSDLKTEDRIVTFQGFFDNVNIDIYDSYLAFDILDDLDNPSDITKINFLQDPNYNTYETAARQAGFFVDQNKPWRLVADLQSAPMVAAIKRRYKATEELLKTKEDVYKIIAIKNNVFSQDVLLSGEENLNYLISLVFGNLVQDKKYILNFIDYFRKEFPSLQREAKILRDIFATYIDGKKIVNSFLTLDQVDFPNKEIKISNLKLKETVFLIYKTIYDIAFILDENKTTIDFIFQSLESQLSVLKSINKPISKITSKDVYDSIYCKTSDYVYFTFLPRKLEQFYNIFINQGLTIDITSPETELEKSIKIYGKYDFKNYNSYTTFSKTNDNKTKVVYIPREKINLNTIKITSNIQNNFYDIATLIEHLENRLFEESITANQKTKDEIINQVKILYQKSLQEFNNNQEYFYHRNLALIMIETYISNLIKTKKEKKDMIKVPFFAQQYLYEPPKVEPLILIERICLTLPERGDILVEQEVCGKFPGSLKVIDETNKSSKKKKATKTTSGLPYY